MRDHPGWWLKIIWPEKLFIYNCLDRSDQHIINYDLQHPPIWPITALHSVTWHCSQPIRVEQIIRNQCLLPSVWLFVYCYCSLLLVILMKQTVTNWKFYVLKMKKHHAFRNITNSHSVYTFRLFKTRRQEKNNLI